VSLRSSFPVDRFHETLSDGGKLLVIKSALMRTSLMWKCQLGSSTYKLRGRRLRMCYHVNMRSGILVGVFVKGAELGG